MQYEDKADCVGEGWRAIVQPLIDRAKAEGRTILQIKEKFGGLRFYYGPYDEEFQRAVDVAEEKSIHTCEWCGTPGRIRVQKPSGYWLKCLCEAHHAERDAEYAKAAEVQP